LRVVKKKNRCLRQPGYLLHIVPIPFQTRSGISPRSVMAVHSVALFSILEGEFAIPKIQPLEYPSWACSGNARELRNIQGGEVLAPGRKLRDDFRVAEFLAIDEREQPGQLAKDGVHAVLPGRSGHSG